MNLDLLKADKIYIQVSYSSSLFIYRQLFHPDWIARVSIDSRARTHPKRRHTVARTCSINGNQDPRDSKQLHVWRCLLLAREACHARLVPPREQPPSSALPTDIIETRLLKPASQTVKRILKEYIEKKGKKEGEERKRKIKRNTRRRKEP